MDATFWIGVSVGLVVSFIGSLFANYLTPTFSDFMSRGMASVVERSRKTAMWRYARVSEFQSGKSDRYFYMLNMWGWTISCWIGSATLAITALFVIGVGAKSYIPLVCSLFLFLEGIVVLLIRQLMQSRLANFDGYKQKLIERWGAID
jgi:hypothetical protein